jgi:hypothetical protein
VTIPESAEIVRESWIIKPRLRRDISAILVNRINEFIGNV